VEVTVTAMGPSIPAVELPRIFERFYRVDEARAGSGCGSGLRPAIVEEIVEAHCERLRELRELNGPHQTLQIPQPLGY